MKEKKNILITDADGTLFDNMTYYQGIFADILSESGIVKKIAKDYYFQTAGIPIQKQFSGLLSGADDATINRLAEKFFKLTEKKFFDIFPKVSTVLPELYKRKVCIVVISGSNTSDLTQRFAHHKLPFKLIVGSDRVEKGDECIKFIRYYLSFSDNIMSAEELSQRAILLGDGKSDMKLASRNNILAMGITNTFTYSELIDAGAGKIISDISEILPFF